MSRFFNYINPVCVQNGISNVFAYDPSILSLREILLFELKQIAYYAIELEKLDSNTKKIREKIVDFIDLAVVNLDFKRSSFNQLINDLRKNKINIEKRYKKACKKNGITPVILKSKDIGGKNIDLIKAISEGEKESIFQNNSLSVRKKSLYEIIMNLIAKACFYLSEIILYENKRFEDIEKAVINLLNLTNFPDLSEEEILSKIQDFNIVAEKLLLQFKYHLLKEYGPITETEVSLLTKKGKAILVSGHFFKDLELVLEATKNSNINVYTHGDMLIAHSLKKFKKYKNLVGHYQRSGNDLLLDYSSFPGSILISRNSTPHIDLIRGRIYTFANNPAFGMSSISENDLSPLIQAAKDAKGFKSDKMINHIIVGYNQKEIKEKLQKILKDLDSGKIKHLFLIDMINYLEPTDEYMNKFLSLIPEDCFCISLSYDKEKENIWHIPSYSGMLVFYEILNELKTKYKNISKLPLTIYLTRCDRFIIFHILHLIDMGVKDIYLGDCCPTAVSPTLVKGLRDLYNVHKISTSPESDLETILNKKVNKTKREKNNE